MGMKLVSINVEHDRHVESVRGLLEREKADVVMMMEVGEVRVIGGVSDHKALVCEIIQR